MQMPIGITKLRRRFGRAWDVVSGGLAERLDKRDLDLGWSAAHKLDDGLERSYKAVDKVLSSRLDGSRLYPKLPDDYDSLVNVFEEPVTRAYARAQRHRKRLADLQSKATANESAAKFWGIGGAAALGVGVRDE